MSTVDKVELDSRQHSWPQYISRVEILLVSLNPEFSSLFSHIFLQSPLYLPLLWYLLYWTTDSHIYHFRPWWLKLVTPCVSKLCKCKFRSVQKAVIFLRVGNPYTTSSSTPPQSETIPHLHNSFSVTTSKFMMESKALDGHVTLVITSLLNPTGFLSVLPLLDVFHSPSFCS